MTPLTNLHLPQLLCHALEKSSQQPPFAQHQETLQGKPTLVHQHPNEHLVMEKLIHAYTMLVALDQPKSNLLHCLQPRLVQNVLQNSVAQDVATL
ncbi:hypothetical protein V6N13_025480 [Hibiscus sabdariffa]|uniref:Uncharacterized protein n=1 Tax=Hibiscus sabdariffa TaxID=183260 RepID=A0ABR2P8L2_9ROSI